MTREEAINKLVNARYADEFQGDEELTTAHLMAIKALEQEPTDDATLKDIFCMGCEYKEQEPCEDVIDRAEAMTEIMMFAGNVKSDEEDIYIKVSDAVQLLRELPPVKPQEPKTGHWIYKQYGGYPEQGNYHCSECDNIDNRTPAYCPHCGCCMFEPQESEG